MRPDQQITFGPFRLDEPGERLWRGSQTVSLRPKAFALLRYLLGRPGQLVTKEQLLEQVWPGTFVSDAVLKDSIRQLRQALEDNAAAPRYIETAHRRGYRFVGQLGARNAVRSVDMADGDPTLPGGAIAPAFAAPHTTSTARVIGREASLASLHHWIEQTLRGERQVVFVTGESGIGKTALIETFLDETARTRSMRTARGHCLEQYGAVEPYLPVLDALARLCQAAEGAHIVDLLRQHAPTWLAQMPSLIPAAERAPLRQDVPGATRERMLREMAGAVEAMAMQTPLVLVLEDLHWSDFATLDLISYLARRREPARLMVIGTYRPVDVILTDHPLRGVKRELQAHDFCRELPLDYLGEGVVASYLSLKFPEHDFPVRLARAIHRRTEGNPLFMVNVLRYLQDENVIVEHEGRWRLAGGLTAVELAVPENLRQLIEKQIEHLRPDEQRVLEGAAVVGMACSTVAIAAGLDEAGEWVEARCEELVRRHQFLLPARLVELPDGTITPRYTFVHVLYLDVAYGRIPAMRRAEIHRRIGERGEAIYDRRTDEIAAELAMHFEEARDSRRAVKYLLLAAENATHRSAHHESAALARRGIHALEALSDTPERDQQELRLLMILGVSLMAVKGFAAAEVEDIYRRALDLCAQHGDPRQAFMVRWSSGLFHYFRAELRAAHEIAVQLLDLAAHVDDSLSTIEAHRALGVTLLDLGRFGEALEHLDKVSVLYGTRQYHARASFTGQDPKVVGDCFAARALWALGYPDQALQRIERAQSLAQELSHAESLVIASHFAAHLHQLRGEASLTQARAETVIALGDEYGLEMWTALGHIHRGWARSERGQMDDGIEELRSGMLAYQATGGRLWRAHFLGLLAQALAKAQRPQEGLDAVAEAVALAQNTGEHYSVADLHRIHGELLIARATRACGQDSSAPETFPRSTLSGPVVAEAQQCFTRALTIARQQHAKSWELRALTSARHLIPEQREGDEARRILNETFQSFTEGHETSDLKAAKAVLKEI